MEGDIVRCTLKPRYLRGLSRIASVEMLTPYVAEHTGHCAAVHPECSSAIIVMPELQVDGDVRETRL